MSYNGVLKSTISQNTRSIFEKNAPVAVYQTGAYLEEGIESFDDFCSSWPGADPGGMHPCTSHFQKCF